MSIEDRQDGHDRHSQQRWEYPEVGVRVSVMEEGLYTKLSFGNIEMTMRHRPSLQFVEVGWTNRSGRIG